MSKVSQLEKTDRGFVKGTVVGLTGGSMVAHAMRQTNPDVVAAYPITPQTVVQEAFCEMIANGEADTEVVLVESEHAAMSTCVGASAAGGRAQTASAGAGIALMWEVLWVASGSRLPIVMHVVNRSLSAPLNILGDHTDAMGTRDTGWVELFAETGQESYDNAIQSVRIAEHPEIMLPVMQCQDGFSTSHSVERGELLPDEAVRRFIGAYKPKLSLLDIDHPTTFGANDDRAYFSEHKRQQYAALEKALEVIPQIGKEYGDLTGRYYGLTESYRLEDAEVAVVIIGSTAGAFRVAIDELRDAGAKVGMLKIRSFRPFPAAEVAKALARAKVVAVMDRSTCFGAQGNPLFLEVCTALLTHGLAPKVVNYVYSMGGRDLYPKHAVRILGELREILSGAPALPVQRFWDITA